MRDRPCVAFCAENLAGRPRRFFPADFRLCNSNAKIPISRAAIPVLGPVEAGPQRPQEARREAVAAPAMSGARGERHE
jgi:hypothetical protein